MKAICLAAAMGVAAMCAAGTGAAVAQDSPTAAPTNSRHGRHVEANGRCGGISYGTGARRCGTRTGGPVGGISGRN